MPHPCRVHPNPDLGGLGPDFTGQGALRVDSRHRIAERRKRGSQAVPSRENTSPS
jgi:hypothetical protein